MYIHYLNKVIILNMTNLNFLLLLEKVMAKKPRCWLRSGPFTGLLPLLSLWKMPTKTRSIGQTQTEAGEESPQVVQEESAILALKQTKKAARWLSRNKERKRKRSKMLFLLSGEVGKEGRKKTGSNTYVHIRFLASVLCLGCPQFSPPRNKSRKKEIEPHPTSLHTYELSTAFCYTEYHIHTVQ